jgi:hypothetical protein
MDSLEYILNKFSLRKQFEEIEKYKMPIEIVNFGRDQLAELFRELALTSGAEIGVEQGVYSKILLEANPRLQLYAIDAWKSYRGYRDHTSQRKLDDFYQITKDRLKQFNHRCNILRGSHWILLNSLAMSRWTLYISIVITTTTIRLLIFITGLKK